LGYNALYILFLFSKTVRLYGILQTLQCNSETLSPSWVVPSGTAVTEFSSQKCDFKSRKLWFSNLSFRANHIKDPSPSAISNFIQWLYLNCLRILERTRVKTLVLILKRKVSYAEKKQICNHNLYIYIYIKGLCLSVCLFVCLFLCLL